MPSDGAAGIQSQQTIKTSSDSASISNNFTNESTRDPMLVGEGVTQSSVFTFMDANLGEVLDISNKFKDISTTDHFGDSDLDQFLSRPRLIQNILWTSTYTPVTFSPWKDFFDSSVIKNKIANYAYLRCNMHVKFVVNSTPYYFGDMQCAYFPMDFDNSSQGYMGSTVDDTLEPYIQSVLPCINVLPHKNQGGEMVLPFVYDRNFLPLKWGDGLAHMGKFSLTELAILRDLQLGTPEVLIQVYAWATDVVLTGSTAAIVMQADEYGTRPVSKTATAIANAAGYFRNIPVIGPFATATSIGAKAISAIATIFGYTNVPSLEPAHALRPTALGDCASASIGSSIEKLSLDPKNELSVDPRIVGAEKDEMALMNIIQKRGLVYRTTVTSFAATGTSLMCVRVLPNYFRSASNEIYFPPISHVAALFGQWRGDIVYTLRCIKTVFHRGRIRVAWDPQVAPILGADGAQTSFNLLWDLTKDEELEFTVPYQAATAFLGVQNPANADNIDVSPIQPSMESNGCLSLIVETPITPIFPAPAITILLYVRAGKNFQFANPVNVVNNSDSAHRFSYLAPQSGMIDSSERTTWHVDHEEDPNLYAVHMGERVESLRPLLYRTNHHCEIPTALTSITQDLQYNLLIPRRPRSYGYDLNGFEFARNQANSANARFNWVQQTPYTWMAPAYAYERGSHIYRVVAHNMKNSITGNRLTFPIANFSTTFPLVNGIALGTNTVPYDGNSRAAIIDLYANRAKGQGASVSSADVNNSVQIAAPLYSDFRAVTTLPLAVNIAPGCVTTSGVVTAPTILQQALNSANGRDFVSFRGIIPKANPANQGIFDIYHSVGVDFSLVFYRGCPRMYVYSVTPGPPV